MKEEKMKERCLLSLTNNISLYRKEVYVEK